MDEYGFAKEVFLESVEDDRAADDPLQWVTSIFTASKQVINLLSSNHDFIDISWIRR